MNQYKLTKAGVNPNQGIARLGGKIELYEKMLNKFPRDEHYRKLKDAIGAGDVEEAFQYAHALKGMTGNMSMTALYDAFLPLVEELRIGSMEHTAEYMSSIEKKYLMVIEAIGLE